MIISVGIYSQTSFQTNNKTRSAYDILSLKEYLPVIKKWEKLV